MFKEKQNAGIVRARIAWTVILLVLVISLTAGWRLYLKTEVMHYTADEAMEYAFKGISHELRCTAAELDYMRETGFLDGERFAVLCQNLNADIFYSMEAAASFDYGVEYGYNDYDIFNFYCYFFDLAMACEDFSVMEPEKIEAVRDSLYRICTEFNRFNWNLPGTDQYAGISLKAYDFDGDPNGVREHLAEMEALAAEEQEMLKQLLQD